MKALLVVLALLAGACSTADATTRPTATQTPCELAFHAASLIPADQDTVQDLDSAVYNCATLVEWTAAAAKYPSVFAAGVSPETFARTRCDQSYLADTPLCRSLR